MKVRISLFALAKQLSGTDSIEVELPEEGRVGDLRPALNRACQPLSPLTGSMMFAVEANYVSDDFPLKEGSQVACILPVSGG
jgi:molybdopterin synthase sulfur carrier subunit